jgi:hypothetical protein
LAASAYDGYDDTGLDGLHCFLDFKEFSCHGSALGRLASLRTVRFNMSYQ